MFEKSILPHYGVYREASHERITVFKVQTPVVLKVDNAIHRINPLDSAIGFPNTYPLDIDLSGGYRYPTFEQLGPGI